MDVLCLAMSATDLIPRPKVKHILVETLTLHSFNNGQHKFIKTSILYRINQNLNVIFGMQFDKLYKRHVGQMPYIRRTALATTLLLN